jgi:hypothetical protein
MTTLREDLDSKIAADTKAIEAATADLALLNSQKTALENSGVLDVFAAEEPTWFAVLAARYGYAKSV